jgi:hypothetical protein
VIELFSNLSHARVSQARITDALTCLQQGCCGVQARRMSRMSTYITTQSIIFALLSITLIIFWNPFFSFLVFCYAFLAFLSSSVSSKTRKAANLKAAVPSDREFSIWSSLLYVLSVEQFVVSLGVIWEAMTEYKWSDASEGAAAFCFLFAAVVSLAAAGIGQLVGARHLLSNDDVLVRVSVLITVTPTDGLCWEMDSRL